MTMHIGDKIRKVRELKGYKQEYVADQLGMSVTAYGNLERGDSSPSFDRLEEIAKVLEVSVVDILNIPDQLNIHSICNSNNIGFQHTFNDYRTNEKEFNGYKMAIEAVQKENEFLKEQVRQPMEMLGKK
ncbi:MAG: helix-turn-helix transcriptional regulator [Williamsia sp.]|nr:helix-turn-helix transcriptional regulator [Williamsia sp.]